MKKGPRCPVCGSLNIKVSVDSTPVEKSNETKKDRSENRTAVPGCEQEWKCGDCYRKFPEPDKKTI
jgi:hypothetical protein